MSERTRRLDHLLREEISAIIRREVEDPRIGFVTITSVDVTSDLRHATVWVSVIGSDEERRASIAALGRAMPFVRHHLGGLRLKRIPELRVREDDSAVRGTRVLQLLEHLEEGSAGSREASTREGSAEEPGAGDPGAMEPGGSVPGAPVAAGGLPSLDLPTPRPTSTVPSVEASLEPVASSPMGGRPRRRVDRQALRAARQRRGR